MTVRFYSSVAQISSLTAPITNVATTMTLTTVSGWPVTTPFTAVIDPDTPNAEIVNVSATAGPVYTIQRGIDGSSAIAHNGGAVVRHMATARDFSDSRSHENASADVHGIGGSAAIVGTTNVQTLTNKTLTSPVINGATFDNIGPLGAYTNFVPTVRTASGNVVGAFTSNSGRFTKTGRTASVTIETVGNAGLTIPGGDSSAIIWRVPANLTGRTLPLNVVMPTGRVIINAGLGLIFGDVAYNNTSATDFTVYKSDGTFFDGTDLKTGALVTINMFAYECAT